VFSTTTDDLTDHFSICIPPQYPPTVNHFLFVFKGTPPVFCHHHSFPHTTRITHRSHHSFYYLTTPYIVTHVFFIILPTTAADIVLPPFTSSFLPSLYIKVVYPLSTPSYTPLTLYYPPLSSSIYIVLPPSHHRLHHRTTAIIVS